MFEPVDISVANGDTITLLVEGEIWLCPVCLCGGLAHPPVTLEEGTPSDERCPVCEIQFGWDDRIHADSRPGLLRFLWQEWRETWLDKSATAEQAAQNEEIRRQFDRI